MKDSSRYSMHHTAELQPLGCDFLPHDDYSTDYAAINNKTSGCTARWPLRHAVLPSNNTDLCLHLLSYSRFFPNLHLMVIQSLSLHLWLAHLLVSCIVSPINLNFLRHSDFD